MTPPPIVGNLALLRQGAALVARIPRERYRAEPDRSSIGAQYRHILDHYDCLLAGLEGGVVDYDARRRDPEVETDPTIAAEHTRTLERRVENLRDADMDRPLSVRVAATAGVESSPAHGSTLGRELMFLLSHTVHHFAIIRLLLEPEGIACEDEFGMAPSTIAHQAATG